MSNVARLYYFSIFLRNHYPSISKKTNKTRNEIVNYLWIWYRSIQKEDN
jgi:hypothetical protein